MKNKFTILSMGFIIISITGCMSHHEKILDKSLRLHESRNHVVESIMEMATKPGQEKKDYLKTQVSENSLSFFLYTTPLRTIPSTFNFEVPSYDFATMHKLNAYLMKNGTLCRVADLKSLTWNNHLDAFSGSFTFETEYGFKGRCLFKGEGDIINKMVIAKNNSDKISDGYGVFGCTYGRNILNETQHDEAIILPNASKGQMFTKKLANEINVSIRRDGTMTCDNRIVSYELFKKILSRYKLKPKGTVRLFLWIDKQTPEKYIKPVKQRLISMGVPTFQIYQSLEAKKTGRIILIGKELQN